VVMVVIVVVLEGLISMRCGDGLPRLDKTSVRSRGSDLAGGDQSNAGIICIRTEVLAGRARITYRMCIYFIVRLLFW
jgi:hypothetical protein